MVVDRLMALGLVGAEGVAAWALGAAIPRTLGAPASASSAWEVLHYALSRTLARPAQAAAAAAKVRVRLIGIQPETDRNQGHT